jgi:hypothetical protein
MGFEKAAICGRFAARRATCEITAKQLKNN